MKKTCNNCHANADRYCLLEFPTEIKNGAFSTEYLVPKANCTKPKNWKHFLALLKDVEYRNDKNINQKPV